MLLSLQRPDIIDARPLRLVGAAANGEPGEPSEAAAQLRASVPTGGRGEIQVSNCRDMR